jgi:N-acetyltransferase
VSLAITLNGEHVRLEPLRLDHADALAAAAAEPGGAFDFTAVPTNPPAALHYIEMALADEAAGTALAFAIADLSRERIVGSTRYLDLAYWRAEPSDDAAAPALSPTPTVAEIGATWLSASARRTAINTEAKLLMLGHAFDDWGVHRISLKTDARNQQSRRAIERIGATYEGVRRAHCRALDGTIRDTAYYSILHAEWPAAKHNLRRALARPPSGETSGA